MRKCEIENVPSRGNIMSIDILITASAVVVLTDCFLTGT